MRSSFVEALEARQLLTTYYVDYAGGSDSNNGTSASTPWKYVGMLSMKTFRGGDKILFKGGQTHWGKLYLGSDDTGSASAPITIGSYGSGRASINGGNDSAIFVQNTAGIKIENINCYGSGYSTNRAGGIAFFNNKSGGVKLSYVHINNVDVAGFKNGITIGGGSGSSGFKDVQITSSWVHDNQHAGIFTFAPTINVHQGVFISYVRTYNNFGNSADPGVSGHGILLGGTNGGTVDHCVSYSNGSKGNGGAGVWAYDSTKITFQYTESYNNKTNGPHDGDGFDFDQNVTYSVMQYNYSHGNDGAGLLMASKFSGGHHHNAIRYNISVNDARKLNYGGLHVWGRTADSEFYNNTVYMSPKSGSTQARYGIKLINDFAESNDVQRVHFRNNIIQTTGGMPVIYATSQQLDGAVDLKFQGNAYYTSGSSFKIAWGGTTFSSLGSWQSSKGQEKNGSTLLGYVGDPKLTGAGTVPTVGNHNVGGLSAYKLSSASPLINRGLTLSSYGVTGIGSRDFWGTSLPQGGKYDIGADEY